MKKIFFFLSMVYYTAGAQQLSCCLASVNHQNNSLAMNESFAAAHLTPEPFQLQDAKGAMITFKTSDGKDARAYLVKAPLLPTKLFSCITNGGG